MEKPKFEGVVTPEQQKEAWIIEHFSDLGKRIVFAEKSGSSREELETLVRQFTESLFNTIRPTQG